jgi:hypothetical protein
VKNKKKALSDVRMPGRVTSENAEAQKLLEALEPISETAMVVTNEERETKGEE